MNSNGLLYRILTAFYFLPIVVGNWLARRRLLLPLYSGKNSAAAPGHGRSVKGGLEKTVVYMCLKETTASGGLSDRLRGLVSIYAECKRRGVPFKAYFEVPNLSIAFEPNEYDWRIGEDEICYDAGRVYPCMILTYHADIKNRLQRLAQRTMLRHYMRKNRQQIHVYSNMVTADEQYGDLFRELFKPTSELQMQLDHHLHTLGGERGYVSCTFRFRQLLGDLKEGGETLPEEEREAYIQRCLSTVERLHGEHPQDKLLITSDSITFNRRAAALPYVYTIPGEIVHMGFTYDASKAVYLKSFVDYMMLSYAREVCLARDEKMYHSGFPYRAALLGGAEYREIDLVVIPSNIAL